MLDVSFSEVLADHLHKLHQLLTKQHDQAVWKLQCQVAKLEGKPALPCPLVHTPLYEIPITSAKQDPSGVDKPQVQLDEVSAQITQICKEQQTSANLEAANVQSGSSLSSPDVEAEAEPEAESMEDNNLLPRGMQSPHHQMHGDGAESVSTAGSMPELIPVEQVSNRTQEGKLSSLLERVHQIRQRYDPGAAQLKADELQAKHKTLNTARLEAELAAKCLADEEEAAHHWGAEHAAKAVFSNGLATLPADAAMKARQDARLRAEVEAKSNAEESALLKAEIEENRTAWKKMAEEMEKLQAELQAEEEEKASRMEVASQCDAWSSADASLQITFPFPGIDGVAQTDEPSFSLREVSQHQEIANERKRSWLMKAKLEADQAAVSADATLKAKQEAVEARVRAEVESKRNAAEKDSLEAEMEENRRARKKMEEEIAVSADATLKAEQEAVEAHVRAEVESKKIAAESHSLKAEMEENRRARKKMEEYSAKLQAQLEATEKQRASRVEVASQCDICKSVDAMLQIALPFPGTDGMAQTDEPYPKLASPALAQADAAVQHNLHIEVSSSSTQTAHSFCKANNTQTAQSSQTQAQEQRDVAAQCLASVTVDCTAQTDLSLAGSFEPWQTRATPPSTASSLSVVPPSASPAVTASTPAVRRDAGSALTLPPLTSPALSYRSLKVTSAEHPQTPRALPPSRSAAVGEGNAYPQSARASPPSRSDAIAEGTANLQSARTVTLSTSARAVTPSTSDGTAEGSTQGRPSTSLSLPPVSSSASSCSRPAQGGSKLPQRSSDATAEGDRQTAGALPLAPAAPLLLLQATPASGACGAQTRAPEPAEKNVLPPSCFQPRLLPASCLEPHS